MKLISKSVCHETNHLRNVVELVLDKMEGGNILLIQRRNDDYHIMLIGDREEKQ